MKTTWTKRIYVMLFAIIASGQLHAAAAAGAGEDKGAVLLRRDGTPLTVADFGLNPLNFAASRGDIARCVGLLEAGASVNANDRLGTPLHAAVTKGNMPLCQLFLDAGADPHLRDRAGYTPLSLALKSHIAPSATLMVNNIRNGADSWDVIKALSCADPQVYSDYGFKGPTKNVAQVDKDGMREESIRKGIFVVKELVAGSKWDSVPDRAWARRRQAVALWTEAWPIEDAAAAPVDASAGGASAAGTYDPTADKKGPADSK